MSKKKTPLDYEWILRDYACPCAGMPTIIMCKMVTYIIHLYIIHHVYFYYGYIHNYFVNLSAHN